MQQVQLLTKEGKPARSSLYPQSIEGTVALGEKDGAPVLPAYRSRGQESLIIWCLWCEKWHWHGAVGPELGAGNGHRVAHCVYALSPYKETGYYLQEIEGSIPEHLQRLKSTSGPRRVLLNRHYKEEG